MTPREANADLLAEITALRDRVASLTRENTELQGALAQASDQQTATSEILRVISSLPTDLEPVFDPIVRSVVRLCNGLFGTVFLYDGRLMTLAAVHNAPQEGVEAIRRIVPCPPSADMVAGRALLSRATVHVHDAVGDTESPAMAAVARAIGFRTCIAVPMLRDGQPIGALGVSRQEVQPFSETEIELLKTFAAQAVIAIENVRLFNETKEALEQQTATSEILRVISHSPTDVQPVFEAIVQSAVTLCGAVLGAVYRREGDLVHLVGFHRRYPEADEVRAVYPAPVTSGLMSCRAIHENAIIHLPDTETAGVLPPEGLRLARLSGFRSVVAVPMRREGNPIGAILVGRPAVGPLPDNQIALLQTFADQAVIAIENVRLFNETKEALERQTATSEILRVISSSPTDVQPVFDAVADSAMRLCEADQGVVVTYDGELMHLSAHANVSPEGVEAMRQLFPARADRRGMPGRAIVSMDVVHVPSVLDDPEYGYRELAQVTNRRGGLAVPMLKNGRVIGAIAVARPVPGPFSERQIELLKTFAAQAVIAIENVRLFTELQVRTADLTRSVGQLTALGEVGQAVSSSLDLETVLTTIVSRAVQLSGLDGGVIFEYDETAEEFAQRAATEPADALAEARRAARIGKGEGVVGRTAVTLGPAQVPDITVAGAYEGRLRETLIEAGVRAVLAVPMLREGRLIGCLAVTRNTPGDFPAGTIDLLRTFATQSALAIQNARLFREIADKSRQLEVVSQHKSEFLANMSHELRTPLNAIIGYSEMLQEEARDLQQDAFIPDLEKINAAAKHQLSLINDILDLAKIEAGRMELELTNFDLPVAIDNAITLVRERAGRRGITLHATVAPQLGDVRADERKLKQVMLNLLSNAIKFTPEGGRIDVRAGVTDGTVEVSVADTGVGIAPEDQETVFEEFRQVGAADKKVEGTGLGLALVRKFVELHGGRIWVKSQVGQGSMFTFTLPVGRGE